MGRELKERRRLSAIKTRMRYTTYILLLLGVGLFYIYSMTSFSKVPMRSVTWQEGTKTGGNLCYWCQEEEQNYTALKQMFVSFSLELESEATPKNFIYRAEESMRKRAADVRNQCSKAIGVLVPLATENDYIVTLNSTNYAFYPIAKCGWTTWTYVMFDAAGKSEEPNQMGFQIGWTSPFEHAGMQKVRWKVSKVGEYKERLLFVRNPYDRLVSAYKNKVLYGTYNLVHHRPCPWLKEGMEPPTFPQFIRCILERCKATEEKTLASKKVAEALDIHWRPQFWSSLPCVTNYTLIGMFDHLEEDISQTIAILHLNASIPHKNASKKVENETLAYWYNQVPMEDKRALQTLYRLDFEIFNFNDTIPS